MDISGMTPLGRFLQRESAGGIMLMGASVIALVLANSPLHEYYQLLLDTPLVVALGDFRIAKPLLLWVDDGLMAIFFLLVGLELKREILAGELSNRRQVILPGLGALGGMVVPALIYLVLNRDDPNAMRGWAIPTATDIAFALGILSLLGTRVPTSLKVFLTSLAIFDDLGAIIIIALFYTSKISMTAMIVAAGCVLVLYYLNRKGIADPSLYVVVGVVMWVALLKSGVHATLAGVILAMFVPLKTERAPGISPLENMEQDLHSLVAFVILPVFAFCNAGIRIIGVSLDDMMHPIPLGITLGLFIGKQIGVFGFCWVGVKLGLAEMAGEINWRSLYGVSLICGIGFTMSLFISSLAFEESGINVMFDDRLGIISGSLLSGIFGFLVLYYVLPRRRSSQHDS